MINLDSHVERCRRELDSLNYHEGTKRKDALVLECIQRHMMCAVQEALNAREGKKPQNSLEIRHCETCDMDTMHLCHDSGHERDSSGDFRECFQCGARTWHTC